MMKSKFRLSAILSPLCVALLALLGYSCKNDELMYGMPYGEWEIKGEVTDEDNKPVENATIIVTHPDVYSYMISPEYLDEYGMRTDKDGKYVYDGRTTSSVFKIFCLPEDDSLKPDSAIVDFKFSGKKKNDAWYLGSDKATVNFRLKKKE